MPSPTPTALNVESSAPMFSTVPVKLLVVISLVRASVPVPPGTVCVLIVPRLVISLLSKSTLLPSVNGLPPDSVPVMVTSPSNTTLPVPAGIILMFSFDLALVMLKPLISKSPPSCGVVSSTTLLIPPLPVASIVILPSASLEVVTLVPPIILMPSKSPIPRIVLSSAPT